jgi:Ca2+-binding EF-hand superfamily protein
MLQASQIFRYFDTDHSGNLSKKEWKRAMWQLGYYMSKHDAKVLFRLIDTDGSGKISEREFCEFWFGNA